MNHLWEALRLVTWFLGLIRLMKYVFFVFTPWCLIRILNGSALSFVDFILFLKAHFGQYCIYRINLHLSHQNQEVDMGFRGHLRVKYFIWALLCFDWWQPCTSLLTVSAIGLQLIGRHVGFIGPSFNFLQIILNLKPMKRLDLNF